jgi:peptide/nickel transport system substrate-binding protein
LYQGLFTVDRDYNVEPVLCSRYAISDDMTTYTFYIDEKATFSDGSKLTIQDVEASLLFAQTSALYGGRFAKVSYIGITEDGGLTMRMSTPYENLPILLNVPILKADQLEAEYPLGTGPYFLSVSAAGAQLVRRSNWWCVSDLCITAPIINLVKAESTTQIRDEFQFGDVDLVQAETGSDRYAEYLSDYELWDVENGIFLYMVCHKDSMVFSNDKVRSALTFAIDRDYLVKEYYRGFARSATLPASPQFPYYNQTLASRYAYQDGVLAKAVKEAGMSG